MKTKLYFLFALIVLANCSATIAQSNFAPVGATWYHSGFEGVYKSIAEKDTIVLGKNCRQIKQRIFISWPGPIYREDLGLTRDCTFIAILIQFFVLTIELIVFHHYSCLMSR